MDFIGVPILVVVHNLTQKRVQVFDPGYHAGAGDFCGPRTDKILLKIRAAGLVLCVECFCAGQIAGIENGIRGDVGLPRFRACGETQGNAVLFGVLGKRRERRGGFIEFAIELIRVTASIQGQWKGKEKDKIQLISFHTSID